jgi:hypothetical protein
MTRRVKVGIVDSEETADAGTQLSRGNNYTRNSRLTIEHGVSYAALVEFNLQFVVKGT